MTTKTEISNIIINLMGRGFPVSNYSETMDNNDSEIETHELNRQDMNSANEDEHKKPLESNKYSQLSDGNKSYQEKFRLKNVI